MALSQLLLQCPACQSAQSVPCTGIQDKQLRCRSCDRKVTALLLPRLFSAAPPPLPVSEPAPGDAVCFYDPKQKATCMCAQCGVLVSESWSVQWGSRRICQRCFDKLRSDQRDSNFESSRLMWDNICLLLVLAPLTPLSYFMVIFTAPAAFILGLRAWKKPGSLMPRSRFRLGLAILLAVLQVTGVIAFFAAIIFGAIS